MLSTSKLVAFVPIRDSARSRPFYEGVLGLRFIDENPFALLMESNGVRVRLAKTPNFTPAGYTVLGWQVDDIQTMVTALMQKGVSFERFPGMDQDKLGIWAAPSGAKVAWFKDPDGNILSLAQHP
ncbi:MAG TPA: VOC family protein [Candidatus Angelobacter sp.]|nr:VOC family protein [Candidatus Angelobacter sp.]